MLQLQQIKENTSDIIERLKIKNVQNVEARIDEILKLDEQRRALQQRADAVKAEQNAIAKEIGILFKQGKRDEAEEKKARTTQRRAGKLCNDNTRRKRGCNLQTFKVGSRR